MPSNHVLEGCPGKEYKVVTGGRLVAIATAARGNTELAPGLPGQVGSERGV